MHYHCEIIIPPTSAEDIEDDVKSVLSPFDENGEDEDGMPNRNAFWDWYVIGGRWAGTKLLAQYDAAQVRAFESWLEEQKITVSGLQSGKPTLSPGSQIATVDAKWQEMFPTDPPIPCPLFSHSNDQYGREGRKTLPDDVLPLAHVPERLRIARVIFAGPDYESKTGDFTGPPVAKFMLSDAAWNGCNHMPVKWDGSLADALAQYRKQLAICNPEYRTKFDPTHDWLVVTVDYHS